MGFLEVFCPLASAVAFVCTVGLLADAVRKSGDTTAAYERRFRAFKYVRVGTYGSLAAIQAALIVARQAAHWPDVSAVDYTGGAVLLSYALTLVSGFWQRDPRCCTGAATAP